jgi:phage shock protein C
MAVQGAKKKPPSSGIDQAPRKLYKSRQNRVIDGVCGGLSEYFCVDPTLIRVGWVILALLWGAGIVAYVIAMIVMPRQPEGEAQKKAQEGTGQNTRIWWAALLILAGLILLMQTHIPGPYHLWFWWRPLGRLLWPLLLVLVGLWILGTQLRKSTMEPDQGAVGQKAGKKLYRDTSERMLAGVCGGLAEFLRIDPSIVRVLWALATLASVGVGVIVYVIMWILVPERPEAEKSL